jgi:hypothetical protein
MMDEAQKNNNIEYINLDPWQPAGYSEHDLLTSWVTIRFSMDIVVLLLVKFLPCRHGMTSHLLAGGGDGG